MDRDLPATPFGPTFGSIGVVGGLLEDDPLLLRRRHRAAVAGRGAPGGRITRVPQHDNLATASLHHAPVPFPACRSGCPRGGDLLKDDPAFGQAFGHSLAPGVDPDPSVDVREVALDGSLGQSKDPRSLPVAHPACDESQDLSLPHRQP
jgi:hypothetical protein